MTKVSLLVYTLVGFTLGTGLVYMDLAVNNIRYVSLTLFVLAISMSIYTTINTVRTKKVHMLKLAVVSTSCVVVTFVSTISIGLVMVTLSLV